MIAFHGKEWERVATALMAMPRPQWDLICATFPDLPPYAVSVTLVIAKINNFGKKTVYEKRTAYYIANDLVITVYHREENHV